MLIGFNWLCFISLFISFIFRRDILSSYSFSLLSFPFLTLVLSPLQTERDAAADAKARLADTLDELCDARRERDESEASKSIAEANAAAATVATAAAQSEATPSSRIEIFHRSPAVRILVRARRYIPP